MKLIQFSSLLVVFLCVAATESSKRAVFEVRHVLKSPNAETETLTLFEATPDSDERRRRQIHVVKAPLMDVGSVSSAAAGIDELGRASIEIVFTAKGRRLFSEITREHVKEQLAFVAEGTVLSAPVVHQEIKEARGTTIPVQFSKQEAEQIASKINEAIQK